MSSSTGPVFATTGSTNVTYTVPNVLGETYQWTVPAGTTITSGQGTNSITEDFGTSASGTISLTQTNTNGSTQVQQTITLGTAPVLFSISVPTSVTEGSTGITYSVASVPCASYQWSIPSGVSITSGQGTNSITVSFGTSVSGFESHVATNVFGTSTDFVAIQVPQTMVGARRKENVWLLKKSNKYISD